MNHAHQRPERACSGLNPPTAWEIKRVNYRSCRGTTLLTACHVVNYKALTRTSTPRKRLRSFGPPAGRPRRLDRIGKVLARELHDSVGQTLATMLMELDNFRAEQYGRASVLRQVELLEQSTRQALSELRTLLVELRADQVGEQDLVKLVSHDIVERQGRGRAPEFGLTVTSDWPQRIQATTAMELHRMVGEAIENGIRHGRAKRIEVSFGVSPDRHLAVLTVKDDGRGLVEPEDFDPHPRLGILGMRERAVLLGGGLELEPGPDGCGTTVRFTVPLAAITYRGPEA
jgi:nitrate/nitrite-specific signal transduction histidine kinase